MASVGTCIRSLIRMILWWENLGRSGARVPQRETRTKCEFPSKNFKIFFASMLLRHHNTPHKPIKLNSYTCHFYTYWKPRIPNKKLKSHILKTNRIRTSQATIIKKSESRKIYHFWIFEKWPSWLNQDQFILDDFLWCDIIGQFRR